VHPLLRWSDAEVDSYIDRHDVPVHALHAQGYPSVGCAPCTRVVGSDEPARAGRWWWEASHRECGLHRQQDARPGRPA
jgi:phosphoadenosine phosphosulfate reductase